MGNSESRDRQMERSRQMVGRRQRKTFYRVLAGEGGVYELYSDHKHWNLYRVFD